MDGASGTTAEVDHDSVLANARKLVAEAGGGEPSTSSPPKSSADINALMKTDPKFISRLINQLDKQMGDMTEEKRQREAQIAEDKAEIERIDKEISTHINPGMAAVMENLRSKEQIRDSLRTQLDAQTHNFSSMERDARSLLLRATHAGGKVSRAHASATLKEARGYSASTPTTELIKSKKGSSASLAESAGPGAGTS